VNSHAALPGQHGAHQQRPEHEKQLGPASPYVQGISRSIVGVSPLTPNYPAELGGMGGIATARGLAGMYTPLALGGGSLVSSGAVYG